MGGILEQLKRHYIKMKEIWIKYEILINNNLLVKHNKCDITLYIVNNKVCVAAWKLMYYLHNFSASVKLF